MRTLVPCAGLLLLSGAPVAAVADVGGVAAGAQTRPLAYSSRSKGPSSATTRGSKRGRIISSGKNGSGSAPAASTGDGNRCGVHRLPGRQQLPSSSIGLGGGGGELLRTLRGGWLGVDLIQEIAKAYLSPASAASAGGDAASTAAAAAEGGGGGGGSRAAGQKGSGSGSGSGTGPTAVAVASEGAKSVTSPTKDGSGDRSGGSHRGERGDAGATATGVTAAGRRSDDRKNSAGSRASRGALGGDNDSGGGDRGKDGRGGGVVGRGKAGAGRSDGVQGKIGRLRSAMRHQMGGAVGRDAGADAGTGGRNSRLDTASGSTSTSNVPAGASASAGGGGGGGGGGYNPGGVNSSGGSPLPPSSAGPNSITKSEGVSNGANANAGTPGDIDAGRTVGGNGGAVHGYGDNGFANQGYADSKRGFHNQGEADAQAHAGGGGGGEGEDDLPGWEDLSRGAGQEEAEMADQGGNGETGEGEAEEQGGDANAAKEKQASDRFDESEREFWAEVQEENARALAAAARTRDEIALLREIEARSHQQGEVVGVVPPLGQHTRSVVTQAMPIRFVDEVGAHIATALAIAAARGLIHMVMNIKGSKKPEKVMFKDILGCDEAKEEVKQIVDFLVDPSAYDSIGASRPKGILLVGPPGTGKTLIAKACAGEAGVPFLYACGSDFNGVYVGMGVAAVKRLFAKARKHKKSIIYIDEIDYLGRARNSGSRDASGATQDREATLNQLLSEMDGFEGKDGIVVMASTNRKEILDDALLRSGRFDMQVDVERPDRKGRAQLFSKYIAPLKLSDEEQREEDAQKAGPSRASSAPGFIGGRRRFYSDTVAAAAMVAEKEKEAAIRKQELREDIARELADMTPYMTGADVANVCATAGRIAARAGSDAVELEHFSAAVDRVQHGLEKPDKEVPQEDKERTATHEAGHAVAAWMLPWCEEVVKVSIVWRGNALGFSQTAMVERQSQMREMVLDSVCMTLAGRAAEEVVCGTISGGASSDLRVASRQLYSAITEVGFGSSTGLLSPGNRPLSESVMAKIDEEVQALLAQQYQRALALIRTHRDKVDRLSEALLERNVVHKADLLEILGEKVTVESEVAAAEAALAAALDDDAEDSRSKADTDGSNTKEKRTSAGLAYGWAWPSR